MSPYTAELVHFAGFTFSAGGFLGCSMGGESSPGFEKRVWFGAKGVGDP